MKKLFIIFIGLVFLGIAGCDKIDFLKFKKKTSAKTNDLVTELIKSDIIEDTNVTALAEETQNIIEPVVASVKEYKTNIESTAEEVKPEYPEKTSKVVKAIKDKPIEVPDVDKKTKVIPKKGCYIKVGNDTYNEIASPRKYIKMTFLVYSDKKNAKYVDFRVYAIPKGSKLKLSYYNLIAYAKNIEIFNNQAQFTRYWNGKNVDQDFLPKGKYNIYLLYKIKDKNKEVIISEGRYWGDKEKISLTLY